MSRTILVVFALTTMTGCYSFKSPNYGSIATARLETLGPNWTLFCSGNGACECIPPRPFTCGYLPAWDFHITEHTAHCCAFRAFHEYRQECGRAPSHHFKMGFITAYEDLALNRRPSPPIIPPPQYWNAFYRSSAGRPFVDDWFAGYDEGLSRGCHCGVSQFHELYLRRNGCAGLGSRSGFGPAAAYGSQHANQFDDAADPQYSLSQGSIAPATNADPTPVSAMSPNAYVPANAYGTSNAYGVQRQ